MRCPSCKELLDLSTAKFCPACGTPVDTILNVDPLVGQLVGSRYRVTHLMAEGGMGRVYAAEQAMGDSTRKVAIKVLLAEYSGRDQDMQRLTRECSTVAELEHPNTIKFFDYGETEQGDLFIAMEFLAGQSLAQVIKNGSLPPERVDLLVGQICGSLQEAHTRGIVHRDLKPDNIILTSPGGAPDFVKVLDFGIAKRVGGRDPKLTPLGVVLGSPPYMSPEQFTMQDVDHRSDIYSLGVVIYQMLTGKLPFSASDPLEWAALHMGVPPTPIDAHGVPIPPQMRSAVHRALAKEPQNRPSSMREFYGEFTIGAGTLEPSRFSSMLPLVPSHFPLPARAPSSVPASNVPTAAAQAVTPPGVVLALPEEPAPQTTRDAADERGSSESLDPASAPTRVRPENAIEATTDEEPPPPSDVTALIDPREPPPPAAGDTSVLDPLDPANSPPTSLPVASKDAPTIRDHLSGPEISFYEMSASEISLPPAETTAVKSGKGTLVMAASEPPPKSQLMPDLLPPTIRDPLVQVQSATRRTLVWIAVALVGLGAIASAVGWLVFVRPGPPPKSKKSKASASALVVSAPAPAGTGAPQGALPNGAPPRASAPAALHPPASAEPSGAQPEKLSPCQTAIFSAVSGKCDVARRAHARCAEDSPYRASADRALAGLCR